MKVYRKSQKFEFSRFILQYLDVNPSSNKKAKLDERFSLDKMRQEEEHNLKTRMQLHMLENQNRQMIEQQQQNMQQPMVQSYGSSVMTDSRKSRFDMTMHPNQGPQGPPGVFIPQQGGQPMGLDQGDPWSGGRNPPRYGERPRSPVYDQRMRSRSPPWGSQQPPRSRYDDYGRSGATYDPSRPTESPPRMRRSYSPQRRMSPPPMRRATPPRFPSPPRAAAPMMRRPSPPRMQQQPRLAPELDISKRWSEEMSSIENRGQSQPRGYFESRQEMSNVERLAEAEAQAEAQRLQQIRSQQAPQVIDLADSDDEDRGNSAPRTRMPSPPRLGSLRHPSMNNEYAQPPQLRGWPQVPELPGGGQQGGNGYTNANPPRYGPPQDEYRRNRSPPRSSNIWADSRY